MFLFLVGKAAENIAVLGVSLAGFVLGQRPHLPTIATAQDDLWRIIGNWR